MTIDPSTVESHRFTRVRRNGYDPAEVDAVMSRMASALRDYEAHLAKLENAALRSSDDGESPSTDTAEDKREAFSEAADLIEIGRRNAEELRAEAAEILAAARNDAEAIRQTAETEAAQLLSSALTAASPELPGRLLEPAETAEPSGGAVAGSVADAERDELLSAARTQAEQIVALATDRAEEIIGDARRERSHVERRITATRRRLTEIESKIRLLSTATLTEIDAIQAGLEASSVIHTSTDVREDGRPVVSSATDRGIEFDDGINADNVEAIHLAPAPALLPTAPEFSARVELDEDTVIEFQDLATAEDPREGKWITPPDGSGLLPAQRDLVEPGITQGPQPVPSPDEAPDLPAAGTRDESRIDAEVRE